ADRGPRGVLARAGPQGTGDRERGPGGPRRLLQRQVPGRALLVRLPGLPRPGGPRQGRAPAAAGTHRRGTLRGDAAPPGAVHRRDRHPPPGRQVLQRLSLLGLACSRGWLGSMASSAPWLVRFGLVA